MAKWIWTNQPSAKHQLAYFRKTFDIKNSGAFRFRISAEANYAAYCDGKEFLRGQYSDYPQAKTFTESILQLNSGKHTISIEVYYAGEDFQTSWYSEQPGLWCELENVFASDESWKAKLSDAFLRENIHKITPQLGYVIGFDARFDDDFKNPSFDDTNWANAVIVEKNPTLSPRPVPIMERGAYIDGKLVKSGKLLRPAGKINEPIYAEAVAADTLDTDGNGFYQIYDLGCERTGLIILECDVQCSGIVIDISHGEHLDDGKVRNLIDGRNFTDRYITKKGRQRYTLFRRAGARFIQLNIIGDEKNFTLLKCGMEEEMLPLPDTAKFNCSYDKALKLRENSIRTLRCCMHEHYEDCPWREQALYSYDSRNQMMFGYYLWGNYEYAAANWKLFEGGLRPDGFLRLNAPSKLGPPIANFSVVYITAIYEHYLYSGTKELFESLRSAAENIVAKCIENVDEKTGLYLTNPAPELWHFYEWCDGLSGNGQDERAMQGPRMESIYNLYLLEMFDAMYKLTDEQKYLEMFETQRAALQKTFYDTERKCMLTRTGDKRLHAITQTLALRYHVIPKEDEKQLLERLCADEFIPVSTSSMRYYLEILMQSGGKFADEADKLIENIFGNMLNRNSTTMWETALGADDFRGAGSMCHGWSALPIYYFYRYICGIVPLEAGFKKFAVDITRVEKYGDVSADITTPCGFIHVEYSKDGNELTISHPQELVPVITQRTGNTFKNIKLQIMQ
ncbi:MAG: hypothetical protein IKB77_02020 [Lentisphaeria bacterium]|nr:hypothetical protein [Lentisphaeria bacterium]